MISDKAGHGNRDPLLVAVRLFLNVTMVAASIVAVLLLLMAPAILILHESVVATLTRHGASPDAIWAVVAVLLLMSAMAALGYRFMRHLRRIIASVGEGDAFVPANADRLWHMAWISGAINVLAIPVAILSRLTGSLSPQFRFELQMPFAGLFLALVLFVLARVFREGARMREELEGTV